jgi:predicted RNA-binding Zn ribbon-like protein
VAIDSANGASARTEKPVYELIAGHPVLDLVNTLDWRFRDSAPEELLNDYSDLVRFTAQSDLISASQARRLLRDTSEGKAAKIVGAVRELREAAAQVLYAALEDEDPPSSAVRVLEEFFRDARQSQRLLWSGDKLAWELTPSASLPELPLWLLALSASELMMSDEMDKLRACGNAECRWLFLDTSKNHTRRWCDMKICGNRMKARRFKAQHRA